MSHDDYKQAVNEAYEEYRKNPDKILAERDQLRQQVNSVRARVGEMFLSLLTGNMIGGAANVEKYQRNVSRLNVLEDATSGTWGDYG